MSTSIVQEQTECVAQKLLCCNLVSYHLKALLSSTN